MRKFNKIVAAVLVVLALSMVIVPTAVRAINVPADVYEHPRSKVLFIILTVDSKDITVGGFLSHIDAAPQIKCDLVFAPIAPIVKALGGTIKWNADTGVVTIVLGTKTIVLTIGSPNALVNGTSVRINSDCDAAPYIQDPGITMLPVRFIGEQLGGYVGWYPMFGRVTMIFVRS